MTVAGAAAGCDHVLALGEAKPMGYLPLGYFGKWTEVSAEEAEAVAQAAGIRTRRFDQRDCGVPGGALYAWHPEALSGLLGLHGDRLEGAGWPADADGFATRCAVEQVDDGHPVRLVIAEAFGNGWEMDRRPGPTP